MAETPTKPRRRFFQFSLRTLFVAVTICATASPAVPVLFAKYQRWRRHRHIIYMTTKPTYDPQYIEVTDISSAADAEPQ
jgi:hypothetical protein